MPQPSNRTGSFPGLRIASMALSWNIPTGADFPRWLSRVRELGYDGISGFAWWGWEPFLDEPRTFARMLAGEGLSLASVDVEMFGDRDRYRPVLDFMRANGCDRLVCLSAPRDRATLDDEVAWLNDLGALASTWSVQVCHHPRTIGVAARYGETAEVMQRTDPAHVRLVVETGHSTKDFTDLPLAERTVTLIRDHAERIGLVEAKDYAEATDLNTPLGEGRVPLEPIRDALARVGYTGWIVAEQNGCDGLSRGRPYDACAAISRRKLRELFGV
jgi:sugar phosphate isomerase/epimerase